MIRYQTKSVLMTKIIFFIGIFYFSIFGSAASQSSPSFTEKYQASVSLFYANGKFSETSDEQESDLGGLGFSGELRPRDSTWGGRMDTFGTERETESGALSVNTSYREFRLWLLKHFPLDTMFSAYGGAGVGSLLPRTTIDAAGSSKTITSESYALGGVLIGIRWNSREQVFLDLFLQSTYSPIYPNSYLSSFALEVGYHF